jgi:hypothetical protein
MNRVAKPRSTVLPGERPGNQRASAPRRAFVQGLTSIPENSQSRQPQGHRDHFTSAFRCDLEPARLFFLIVGPVISAEDANHLAVFAFVPLLAKVVVVKPIVLICLCQTILGCAASNGVDYRNFAIDTYSPTMNEIQLAEGRARNYWDRNGARFGPDPRYLAVETSI